MINELADIFGLSKYEASLLNTSMKLGLASMSELASDANISRTATYIPIKGLIEKGLLSVIIIGKRKKFQAINPEQLKYIYQQKKLSLEKIIIELSKYNEPQIPKSDIRYFSGIEGIKTANNILIEESKSRCFRSFDNSILLPSHFKLTALNQQIKRRVEKNIELLMISAVPEIKSWMKKYIEKNKEELRETIFVSYRSYPFETSIITDGANTLVLGFAPKPSALLVSDRMISITLHSIHGIIWDQYSS